MTSWRVRIAAVVATLVVLALLALGARCMSLTSARCSIDGLRGGGPALDVPYAETRPEVVARMLAMGEVGLDDYVIDLGTGDGRILIAAARDRGARGLGIEIDPVLVEEARAAARAAGVADRAVFRTQDLFTTPLVEADVVTMFLLAEVNLRLRPRLLAELKPGARVVSHVFDMGDWRPDATTRVGGARVHAWTIPARVAGRWRLEDADGRVRELRLTQRFQDIAGSVVEGKTPRPFERTVLTGTAISFVIDGRRYRGVVDGDAMKSDENEWRAVRLGEPAA